MLPKETTDTPLDLIWKHWLRAWWPWHWQTAKETLVYRYQECRCGYRRFRVVGSGYQPVDRGWLRSGIWTPRPTEFPKAPSGIQRGERR